MKRGDTVPPGVAGSWTVRIRPKESKGITRFKNVIAGWTKVHFYARTMRHTLILFGSSRIKLAWGGRRYPLMLRACAIQWLSAGVLDDPSDVLCFRCYSNTEYEFLNAYSAAGSRGVIASAASDRHRPNRPKNESACTIRLNNAFMYSESMNTSLGIVFYRESHSLGCFQLTIRSAPVGQHVGI